MVSIVKTTHLQRLVRAASNGCFPQYLVSYRSYATKNRIKNVHAFMSAWQINQYGDVDELKLSDKVSVPTIRSPEDVLVEVYAASVNPIDVNMLGGYGHKAVNALRRVNFTLHQGSEFPLTLGRDFSGRIVALGEKVDRGLFPIGSEVFGAGNVAYQGTFSQYLTISSKDIWLKPKKLNHIEAASLPYVAATSWTAICSVGRFSERSLRRKRVLVLGGSGGIGTFAVQLLKSWGADVTVTCSSDATAKVLELGADTVIDYTQNDVWEELKSANHRFDFVYDTVGGDNIYKSADVLNIGGTCVSIVTPFLNNTDTLGVLPGTAKTACQAASLTCKGLSKRCSLRWALFAPSGTAMKTVSQLVDQGRIIPMVEKVFPFRELPQAFEKVRAKHNRGKTVIDLKSDSSAADKRF